MSRACLSFLLLASALSGCLELDVSKCEGLVCAPGLACHPDLNACVLPEQIVACEDKAEESDCSYAGTPLGSCFRGVCAPRGCGNGQTELGEVCDDGNVLSGDGCSSDCKSAETCGNQIVDIAAGEGCDDGNDVAGDTCQPNCAVPTCGDSLVDAANGEVCDDGNTVPGDGCNVKCTSNETCNNGVVDPIAGEECDDMNSAAGDGCYQCKFEICGNSRVDPDEMCDDGNTIGADGCSANCRSDEMCGNGVIDLVKGEACDAGLANADTPNADCRTDCQPRRCGDDIVDDLAGERCEAGQLGTETCTSVFGYYGGTLTCSDTCGYSNASCVGTCGDGTVQAPEEECDTDAFADPTADCTDYGFYAAESLSCSPTSCTVTTASCTGGRCGDGTKDPVEACDGSDLGGYDCTDLGYYESSGLTCSLGCSFDSSMCTGGTCGDRIRNGTEYCDGTVPTGTTCQDFGQDLGRVGCSAFCGPGFVPDCSRRGFAPDAAPTTNVLRDVWAASDSAIFAVGEGGMILFYNGSGWTQMTSGTTHDLQAVWGLSPTDVYAVGGTSSIATVRHYDGTQWSPVPIPFTTVQLTGVHGTSSSDIWIVGGNSPNATVLHYDGAGWTTTTSFGFGVSFRDVWTPSPGIAFAVGPGGTIRRYSSGVWSSMTPATTATFMRVWGRSATDVYVAAAPSGTATSSSIQHYDGVSWTVERNFGSGRTVNDVFGSDTELYAVVNDSGASGNTDIMRRGPIAGNWVSVDLDITRLWGGALTPSGDVLAVGSAGTIVRGTVSTRALVPAGVPATLTYYWRDVWAFDENEAFMVGPDGVIVRRHFSASTPTGWTVMTSNTTSDLWGVWGASPNRVFAVGAQGTIRMWDGVGPGWITMTTNPATTTGFRSVWGSGPDNVYAAGDAGTIYRYDGNASNEWTPVADFSSTIEGMSGSGPDDIYAVGNVSLVARYNGSTWTDVGVGKSLGQLKDVAVRGPGDVVVVGEGGRISRSTDDGQTWRAMNSGTTRVLTSIAARGPRGDMWVVGLAGELLHYDDERWTTVRSVYPEDYWGVAVANNHVFAVASAFQNRIGFELHRNVGSVERCGNEWDDDSDGLHDCADPDCTGDPYCMDGGACNVASTTLACGGAVIGNNATGSPFPDEYACSPRLELGPDVAYRFTAPTSGSVTATLTNMTADLDLIVVEQHASGGCDPLACVGAASTTSPTQQVTFTATAGTTYQLVVEGFAGATSPFQLSLSCQ